MNPQGGGQMPMGAGNQQIGGNNPVTSQQNAQQQGLMISQTNTLSMGGGQITQNLTPQGKEKSFQFILYFSCISQYD